MFDCLKIWTIQLDSQFSLRIVYFEIVLLRDRFLYDHFKIFLSYFEYELYRLLQLNMAKRRQVSFSDVGPETEEAYKLDALHRLDARNP